MSLDEWNKQHEARMASIRKQTYVGFVLLMLLPFVGWGMWAWRCHKSDREWERLMKRYESPATQKAAVGRDWSDPGMRD